jgi:hypothetical protein
VLHGDSGSDDAYEQTEHVSLSAIRFGLRSRCCDGAAADSIDFGFGAAGDTTMAGDDATRGIMGAGAAGS